jgi:hypothetical protein
MKLEDIEEIKLISGKTAQEAKTFQIKLKDGYITYVSNNENAVYYEIITQWDKDFTKQFTLEELLSMRRSESKEKAHEIISTRYPYYKQINILINDNKESATFIEMQGFINDIRTQENNIYNELQSLSFSQLEDFIVTYTTI